MRLTSRTVLGLIALAIYLHPGAGFSSSRRQCSKPASDLNAIGHRRLFKAKQNWCSCEKGMGGKMSGFLEHQVEMLKHG